jgi:hypothetical protein
MPTYRHTSGRRFLHIHIPRTGGRFFEENLRLNGFEAEQSIWHTIDGVEIAHFDRELYKEHLNVDNIPHITVVRNPLDRFISCSIFLKRMYGDIDKELEDEMYFYSLIQNYPLTEGVNWFRPQVDFISDETHIWNFSDGFGEDFGEWISNILEIEFKIHNVPYGKLTTDETNRVKRTDRIIHNVKTFYRDDYSKLAAQFWETPETKT